MALDMWEARDLRDGVFVQIGSVVQTHRGPHILLITIARLNSLGQTIPLSQSSDLRMITSSYCT